MYLIQSDDISRVIEILNLTVEEIGMWSNAYSEEEEYSNVNISVEEALVVENIIRDVNKLVVKFDSGCSKNMSGDMSRIRNSVESKGILIQGFSKETKAVATKIGINEDDKVELYVENMPDNLVLLSAHDYVSDGAAVLMSDKGGVYKLNKEQRGQLIQLLANFEMTKQLIVKNRTYEVASSIELVNQKSSYESAMSVATRYFNSKVHVSNREERILATLLTGLSFDDIYNYAKHDCINGVPKDISIQSLNQFQHKYGTSPDILQMARPNLDGNIKGYMAPPKPILKKGDRIEADYMFTDFNTVDNKGKSVKLPTLGGAVAAYTSVDCYSGFLHGQLVASVSNAIERVKETIEIYQREETKIETFAADVGVITQSEYKVMIPDVQRYLLKQKIQIECGVPYTHNYGNQHIDVQSAQ
jgi:hypothetical protein